MHNGTIWRWVRPIIARNKDGSYHLRLELRVVPSGPTLIDTIANLVFYVGLTEGLKTLGDQLTEVPFATLEADFYRAAREGLDTRCTGRTVSRPLKQILLERALTACTRGPAGRRHRRQRALARHHRGARQAGATGARLDFRTLETIR